MNFRKCDKSYNLQKIRNLMVLNLKISFEETKALLKLFFDLKKGFVCFTF